MSSDNWQNVSEEIVEHDGKVTTKKIFREIKEPKEKFLRLSKEKIEMIVKLAGLVAVFIAVFKYLDTVKARQQEEVHLHYSDSVSNRHYQDQQLEQQKSLAVQEQNEKAKLEASHNELEARIANSFELITAQKQVDVDKEKREYYLTTLTSASAEMEKLLEKPIFSSDYNSARDNLFIQLYPRIGNIGDPVLLTIFLKFRDSLKEQETVYNIKIALDTIEIGIAQMVQSLTDDSTTILQKYSRVEPDTLWQITNAGDVLSRRIRDLDEYIVNVSAASYFPRKGFLGSKVHDLMDNAVYFTAESYSVLLEIKNLTRMSVATSSRDPYFTNLYRQIVGFGEPRFLYKKNIDEIMKTLSGSLLRQKNEFDARVRKNIDFYQGPNK